MGEQGNSSPASPEVRRLLGSAMVAVGILMASLCGLCTLLVGGSGLIASVHYGGWGEAAPMLALALLVGGVPTAIGALLVRSGLRMRRPRKSGRQPPLSL